MLNQDVPVLSDFGTIATARIVRVMSCSLVKLGACGSSQWLVDLLQRLRPEFLSEMRGIVGNATVLTSWGFCCPFPRSNGACIFQASSVIPSTVLMDSGSGFARDCFGMQARVISVNSGSRYRRHLGALYRWCLRYLRLAR